MVAHQQDFENLLLSQRAYFGYAPSASNKGHGVGQGSECLTRLWNMRWRKSVVPTLDHGIPIETPYVNYLHYRRSCLEFN